MIFGSWGRSWAILVPRGCPKCSKTAPEVDFLSIWTILGPFWDQFWKDLFRCSTFLRICEIVEKSTSGAVLEHFGHPLGAKMAQERHQDQKSMKNLEFWGGPWGPKWSQNRLKIWLKIDLIFVKISEPLFLDLGSILDPKSSPKWGVSGSLFRPCCEYAKSVIWNNPPTFLLHFSILGPSIFDLKCYNFHDFFRSRL